MAKRGLIGIGEDAEYRWAGAGHFCAQSAGGQHDVPNFADFRVILGDHWGKYIGKTVGDRRQVSPFQRRKHSPGVRMGDDFRVVNGTEQRRG